MKLNKKGVAPLTVMIWYTGSLLVAILTHGVATNQLKYPNFKAKAKTVDVDTNTGNGGYMRMAETTE